MILESAKNGNVEDFLKAIKSKEDINSYDENGQLILSIVSKCRFDLVKILLKNKVDLTKSDKNKITPLHWAVEYDNKEIVSILLKSGASPEAIDGMCETPLHWAAWTGHHRCARELLKYMKTSEVKNCGGLTPLDLAIKQKHFKVINLLNSKNRPTTAST